MTRRRVVVFGAGAAAAVAVAVAVGVFLLGRVSADSGAAHDRGYRAGVTAGQATGYANGLRVGNAQGVQDGRALQAGQSVSAASKQPVQDAFNAGYAAGENDAFGSYDGGWGLNEPYVITLESGDGQIVYRISARTPLQTGVDYYLCPDGKSLCQHPGH